MEPSKNEVRWLLFDTDELTEMLKGLDALELKGINTVEGDILAYELREAIENREHVDSEGYNIYIRKG